MMNKSHLELNDLVGQKVDRASKAKNMYKDSYRGDRGEGDIILHINNNLYSLTPVGDCCAKCYIVHIDGSEALQNATIKEVENLKYNADINDLKNGINRDNYYDDVVDTFGHRIHTDKGICSIELRVEHNGYYGGSLELDKTYSLANGNPIETTLLEDF